MKTRHHLIEKILELRAAAAMVYARGVAKGATPEQLTKDIEPLARLLEKMVVSAADLDLESCIVAVQRLENIATSHEMDAEFSLCKAQDSRRHAGEIKAALTARMKRDGVTELKHGDFTACIASDASGLESLLLR